MDSATHGGEDVGDAQGGKGGMTLCDIDIRDVEVGEDLRQL